MCVQWTVLGLLPSLCPDGVLVAVLLECSTPPCFQKLLKGFSGLTVYVFVSLSNHLPLSGSSVPGGGEQCWAPNQLPLRISAFCYIYSWVN